MSNFSNKSALQAAVADLRAASSALRAAKAQPSRPAGMGRSRNAKKRQRRKANGGMTAQPPSLIGQQSGVAVAYSTPTRSGQPQIVRSDRSVRIRHKELVASVNGSVSFVSTKYAVNPGLASTFPWLSTQADSWEEYRFNALAFEFISRTGSNSAGTVQIAPDYDAADAAPTTEQQASAFQDVCEDNAWKNIHCALNPASMHGAMPRKWIRSGNVPGDIKTYDVANVYVNTADESGTTIVGKLWVSYDVEFFIPQLTVTKQAVTQASQYTLITSAQSYTTGVAAPLQYNNTIVDGLGIGPAAAGVFTPPAGAYRVSGYLEGQDTAAEAFTILVSVYKNGAAVAASLRSVASVNAGTNAQVTVPFDALLTCNGTDTVQIEATLTGAAGTLTAPNGGQCVTFTLV